MATPEERMKILKMLEQGKLTPGESDRLLTALDKAAAGDRGAAEGREVRWLQVRVSDLESGRPSLNVNLPISLVNVGLRRGAHFIPEGEGIDLREVQEALRVGLTGKIVDVGDLDEGQRVEVFVG